MATTKNPVPVTARELIGILREEAAPFTPNKDMRNLMARIAARDMLTAGTVRIVTHPPSRRAA